MTTSLDSVVRTFDLPTGRLLDAFRTASVATSVSFSPTSDFLATAHVDSVGVHLWANRAQFADVSLRSYVDEDVIPTLAVPALHGEADEDGDDEAVAELEALVDDHAPFADDAGALSASRQLAPQLASLSTQPKTKWAALLNLDAIRARNKPKEPPKAPERAPFFLPTLPGAKPQFDLSNPAATAQEGGEGARDPEESGGSRLKLSTVDVTSELIKVLEAEDPYGTCAFASCPDPR